MFRPTSWTRRASRSSLKVFEAVHADEALAVLQARADVQAILTDIEMPGAMNGIALAKAVRKRWPGVRIVIISGRARTQARTIICPTISPFLNAPGSPNRCVPAESNRIAVL